MREIPLEDRKLDLEREKLALGREKFELEKDGSTKKETLFQKHPGVIVTGLVSIFGAIITLIISYTEIVNTNTTKTKELELARLSNDAEEDRQWRVALLDFLSKNKGSIFSQDAAEQEQVVSMLELSFPSKYAGAVRNKLTIIAAKTEKVVDLRQRKQVFEELLKPLMLHLDRTKEAFGRWTSRNLYLEAKVIRESNKAVRDLLIEKPQLIPEELRPDALRLVEHYDVWLQEFERVRGGRGGSEPEENQPFVFAGPKGYPFPVEAERHFRDVYSQYKKELEPH